MRSLTRMLYGCVLVVGCAGRAERGVFDPSPHFLAIEACRTAAPVDFGAMARTYRERLADDVRRGDAETHERITAALAAGGAGDRPHVQSQVVSKLLQKVYFGRTMRALDVAAGGADAVRETATAQVAAYYRCLQPTVLRRSEWAGTGRELDDRCDGEIRRLRGAVNAAGAAGPVAVLRATLIDVYVLSIYYELEGIQKSRGADERRCQEKVTEARLFLETVAPHAADSTSAAELQRVLAVECDDVDVEAARRLTARAFSVRHPGD